MKRIQLVTLVFLVMAIGGCKGGSSGPSEPMPPPSYLSPRPALMSAAAPADKPVSEKTVGRAQLWSQICNRCHNTRSPDSYSGNEWALVMTHMRIRGYLTGEDQQAIQQFLQNQ
jgi:hypothetical protein